MHPRDTVNDPEFDRSRLVEELAVRVERFRGEMTDAEFAGLVVDMAHVAARFVEIDERPGARYPADLFEPLLDPSIPRRRSR